MYNKDQSSGSGEIVVAVFGFMALVLVLAVAGEFALPIANDARSAIIVLAVLGLVMCLTGGIPMMLRNRHNITIEVMIGMILGVVALLVLGCRLFGFHLPLIESDQAAFNALALLIIVKVVLAALPEHQDTTL